MNSYAVFCGLLLSIRRQRQMCIRDWLTDVPWRWEVVRNDLKTKDGYWLPCETPGPVSYTHLRAHETRHELVCRLLWSTPLYSSAASDVYKRLAHRRAMALGGGSQRPENEGRLLASLRDPG